MVHLHLANQHLPVPTCNYFVDAVTLRDKVIAITGTKLSVFNSKDIEESFKRFYFHTGPILIRLEDSCIH